MRGSLLLFPSCAGAARAHARSAVLPHPVFSWRKRLFFLIWLIPRIHILHIAMIAKKS